MGITISPDKKKELLPLIKSNLGKISQRRIAKLSVDVNIKKRKNTNTYILDYSCTRGKLLANYIYSNANIFLEGKYNIYKNKVLEVN